MNWNRIAVGMIAILVIVNVGMVAYAAPQIPAAIDEATSDSEPEPEYNSSEKWETPDGYNVIWDDGYNVTKEGTFIEMGENETHPKDPGPVVKTINYSYEADNGTTVNSSNTLNSSKMESHIFELFNEHRVENNLSRMDSHPILKSSARAKAFDMHDRDYYAHYGPDDESPSEFFERSGAECHTGFGENINGLPAIGVSDEQAAEKIFTQWKNSPSHNRLMLSDMDIHETGADTFATVGIHIEFVHKDDYPGDYSYLDVKAVMTVCG